MFHLVLLLSIFAMVIDCKVDTRRLVALGDLHSDLKQAEKNMINAGLIEKKSNGWNWIAKDTIMVQVGDNVDRGYDTIAVYNLLSTISPQAEKMNSKVVVLLGKILFFTTLF
jgi:hypothetical protein